MKPFIMERHSSALYKLCKSVTTSSLHLHYNLYLPEESPGKKKGNNQEGFSIFTHKLRGFGF